MKKVVRIAALCVAAAMLFAACTNAKDTPIDLQEQKAVSSSAGHLKNSTAVPSGQDNTECFAKTDADSVPAKNNTKQSSENGTLNTTAAQKTAAANRAQPAKRQINSTAKTTTKQPSGTKAQTAASKPQTTKPTTTQKRTTAAKSGLSQSDVEWVQAQAHAYMRGKEIVIDPGAGSYSGRISSVNRTKEQMLAEVKDWIDSEYADCVQSGYSTVHMYCKIESREGGSYFLYVLYG